MYWKVTSRNAIAKTKRFTIGTQERRNAQTVAKAAASDLPRSIRISRSLALNPTLRTGGSAGFANFSVRSARKSLNGEAITLAAAEKVNAPTRSRMRPTRILAIKARKP